MFFLLIFVTVLSYNQIIAMQEQQKHAQFMEVKNVFKTTQSYVFKTTQNGKRVFLEVDPKYKTDLTLTKRDLLARIKSRSNNFRRNGDSQELFMKHHLALLVTSYHRNDTESFKALLTIPDIAETTFKWQELQKGDDAWDVEKEQTGTIQQYVSLHQCDKFKHPISELQQYQNLLYPNAATSVD